MVLGVIWKPKAAHPKSHCLSVLLRFIAQGRDGLRAGIGTVVEEANAADFDMITHYVFATFLLQAPLRTIAMLFDGACIALEQVKGSAVAVLAGFIVTLVIAILGNENIHSYFLVHHLDMYLI